MVKITILGPDSAPAPITVHFSHPQPATSHTDDATIEPTPRSSTSTSERKPAAPRQKPKQHSAQHRLRIAPQRALLILSGTCFIACLIVLACWLIDSWQARSEHQELTSSVITTVSDEETQTSTNQTIDFDQLISTNPDTVAWIQIPNTSINYPVVQTTNNETYLSRTFTGSISISGTIFLDADNTSDFSDLNSILYGHHRTDRTMFADLDLIYDGSLGDDVPILIYLPDHTIYTYHVFSSYITANDPTSIDSEVTDFSTFTTTMLNRTERSFTIDPLNTSPQYTSSDNSSDNPTSSIAPRVLTLSTCVANDDRRYLIHAILTEIQTPPPSSES